MRAQILNEHNQPLTMSELPIHAPQKGEVLVRVKASGLNPLDLKIHAGEAAHAQVVLPAVLGWT